MAYMLDSHSSWRQYKQAVKVMIELATRANDPAIQELLLELLNVHGKECDKAHESENGKLALRWQRSPGPLR